MLSVWSDPNILSFSKRVKACFHCKSDKYTEHKNILSAKSLVVSSLSTDYFHR